MIDTSQGQTRIRGWPRKRGAAKTQAQRDSQEKFRQSQAATRYISPTMMADMIDARRGTPILPRDILTSMLAGTLIAPILEDGRKLFPVAFKNTVSDALDVFTQTPGQSLIRGDEYWEAFTPGGGGGGAAWSIVSDVTIAAPTAGVILTLPPLANEVWFSATNLTASAANFRVGELSVDNGATYYTASGDYQFQALSAGPSNNVAAFVGGSSSAAARHMSGLILAPRQNGTIKVCPAYIGGDTRIFVASTLPVTNIRIRNLTGNLTGGRITFYAR